MDNKINPYAIINSYTVNANFMLIYIQFSEM